MVNKQGKISVTTENIFPIIRQWLYSDKDIFLRELVSNASDAISKRKRMMDLGEVEKQDTELRIDIVLDHRTKKLSIKDTGVGMTAEEIEKYINQIAYSGLVDFMEKYEDKAGESANIIGHFGLGFYSAFMVANKVYINTKSCLKDSQAILWESEEGIDFEMTSSTKEDIGTEIILDLSEEAYAEFDANLLQSILKKYCRFMAYPIYFKEVKEDAKEAEEASKLEAEDKGKVETEEAGKEEAEEAAKEEAPKETPINDTSPLWLKKAKDISDQEYIDFYKSTFNEFKDPLFWVHLNLDYPFKLKGILYFPRTNNVYESLEGRIKIYYNQVFVADNVKEIIPDFLFLLQGVIDCPDLPLNVSRSFLQNDQYVKQLSSHIVKKVADKLVQIKKKDEEVFKSYWSDIAVFLKYGMMRHENFYDRVKDIVLFKTTKSEYLSLAELNQDTIYYVPGENELVPYAKMAEKRGENVVIMDHELDNQFMSFLEYKQAGKLKFKRVDAELGGQDAKDQTHLASLEKLFKEVSKNDKLKIELQNLGEDNLAVLLKESEEARRMQEMQKQFAQLNLEQNQKMKDIFALEEILVLNLDQKIVSKLASLSEVKEKKEQSLEYAGYLYSLAKLGQGSLTGQDLVDFMTKSAQLAEEAI